MVPKNYYVFSCIFSLLTPNENRLRQKDFPSRNEQNTETLASLDCSIVTWEEFDAVDDDNVCIASIMAGKDTFEFAQSSKNIIDANLDDGTEITYTAPAPTSSETRNIMKSMSSYLDAHSNGETNNKIEDIKQLVDNLILKKTKQRRI
ncbi:hypothetical protein TNCV_3205491 [Trichonephila clavipes]|nr:hypothetical protein TNCV_3205491 [Trichonephila clavipes]